MVMARFLEAITRKKSVLHELQDTPLARCLSTMDLSVMGIGSMLGSGVYVLTGEVAGEMAGPAAVICFVLAAFVSMLSALCYLECSLRFPEAGASYLYTYVTMGELMAFVIGWNSITIRGLSVIFVARGWSAYFDHAIDWRVKNFTIEYMFDEKTWHSPLLTVYPDILGGIISLLACVLVAIGTKISARASSVFVAANIVTISFTVIMSFVYADFSNLTKNGGFAPMGVEGILKGIAACFTGYCGFEAVAFGAEETKDPRKSIPIAIIASFVAAISMLTMGTFAIVILANWMDIDIVSPFVSAFNNVGAKWMSTVVSIGALCSMTGGIVNNAFCFARAIYVMGRDGLFPAVFASTNKSTQTPVFATMFGGVAVFLGSVFINFVTIVECLALIYLLELINVASVCIILRYSKPKYKYGYECVAEDISNKTEYDELQESTEETESADDDKCLRMHTRNNIQPLLPSTERTLSTSSQDGRLFNISSHFDTIKRLISEKPGHVIWFCLLVLITNVTVIAYILSFMMDKIVQINISIICVLLVDIVLASIACVPLWFLEQNSEDVPFKVPFMPALPIACIVFNIILIMRFEFLTWVPFLVWTAIGIFLYFSYGIRNSKEAVNRNILRS